MNEHLKKELELAGVKAQYDTNAKELLSYKIILAHILVSVTPEFRNLSPEQVVPLIEGEPQISQVPVNPGETNAEEAVIPETTDRNTETPAMPKITDMNTEASAMSKITDMNTETPAMPETTDMNTEASDMPKITGMNTESRVANEGTITYDIHFYVWSPDRTQKIKIIVDIEAQKNLPSQYDIVTRGIFYNARQISAQLGREFYIPKYNEIKKVYSIWLCMNVPGYLENTAVEYPICPNDLVGSIHDYGKYDLANVIVVNLSKDVVEHSSQFHLHRFLETLLSPDMEPKKKMEIFSKEYQVKATPKMERSMGLMCNLSEAIWEEGMEKGKEEGRKEGKEEGLEEGMEKGMEKGRLIQLCELIKMKAITTDQAAKSLNVSVESFNCKLRSIQE